MSSSTVPDQPFHEGIPSFTHWALSSLRCELEPQTGDVWQATLPEALRDDWNGAAVLRFRWSTNGKAHGEHAKANDETLERLDADSALFRWTLDQLHKDGPAAHATPVGQPASVHELATKLFEYYEFPTGHVHLAGCSLEDCPAVRLTLLRPQGDRQDGELPLEHRFYWPTGEAVEDALIESLHLPNITPAEFPPHRKAETLQGWIENAQTSLGEKRENLLAATIIWCKYAHGKLAFEAGEECVTVTFEGWATSLAQGVVEPPPYHCPLAKVETYRLGVTDDGRIAATEGIAVCDETGRHLLLAEVQRCAATGQQADSKLLQACAASGERVLKKALVRCSQCDQLVSPNIVRGGRCSACRALAPIRKDDPRMARLLDEYPKLDRWRRWRISETDETYILLATSWLRQLLLVVDKQSLEVRHIATGGRLMVGFAEMPSGQREELLG